MPMFKNYFKSTLKTKISSNGDFWHWFVKNEMRFFRVVKSQQNIQKNFFNELSRSLSKLRNGYFFLVGMYNDNTAELVLTADGNAKNVVFVEELVQQAPKLKNWIVTALKQPSINHDEGLEMHGYKFSSNNVSFYENTNPNKPDLISITFTHPQLNHENRSEITNGIYLFIENYLGELNMLTIIDELHFQTLSEANQPLNSIEKLNSYLTWRQKEFVEKYEGIKRNTESDKHGSYEATLENGKPLLAVINTDLLSWDSHPSHPWILVTEIKYESEPNGLPNKKTLKNLYKIDDALLDKLKDEKGYLYIGSQTSESIRTLFFACRDFRYPSKIVDKLQNNNEHRFEIEYDLYKDKYWQSFDKYRLSN